MDVKLNRSISRPAERIIATAIVGAVIFIAGCKSPTPPVPRSAPSVVVAPVVERDVPIYTESVGTTEGFVNAKILPRISGYLLKQAYRDGSHVRAGELLFQIDDRPYQAALEQALGNLAQAQAQLKQNQQDLTRYTRLLKAAVIPKQVFDTATQSTRGSEAQVKATAAAVQNARLNLQWTKVYSPLDGVAGIAQAQVGDLVGTTTLLTTISQLDPIKVSFPISEREYLHFADRINARENGESKEPSVRFELILDNGRAYGPPGRFYAANRQVDVETGTIQIQATFPNPEDILRPGMYAKIRARTGVHHDALLVPQSAVFEIQGQYEVAVIGADDTAALRMVKPGKKVGSLWLIEDGLRPGERVVSEGVQKVKDGMKVTPALAQQVPPVTAQRHALADSSASGGSAGRK